MNGQGVSLDLFWKLSDGKENVRTDAATKLLHSLTNKKNGTNDNSNGAPLTYTLERLIRGLASDRKSSLQGFFVSLVELLRQHGNVDKDASIPKVLETIERVLHIKGSKSEESGYLRGKMLCYGAVIRSGIATTIQLGATVEKLVAISAKKNYLAIPSCKIIIESLSQTNGEQFFEHVWPKLVEKLKGELTMDNIWLVLEIHSKFPEHFSSHRSKEVFGRKNVFSDEFFSATTDVFMGGTFPLYYLSKFPAIVKLITEVNNCNSLEKFWLRHVESKVSKANIFKASVATIILNAILATTKESDFIPKLFTNNMIEILLFQLSKDAKSEIETVALAVFDKVINFAGQNSAIIRPILKGILSANIAFDKTTGSTIVQRFTALADGETVKQVSGLYLSALLGLSNDGINQPTSKERSYAAHQLAKLVNHSKLIDEEEWKVATISQIFAVTLLDLKKPILGLTAVPKQFSREARIEMKPAFFKSMDLKSNSLESLCNILVGVAENASKFIEPSKSADLVTPIDAASLKAWKSMMAVVEKIRGVKGSTKRKEDVVFQMLFVHVGFQIFSDPKMAQEVLEELHICYEKSNGKKKRKSVSNAEPEWIEVVVDLLLSLLSQNKHVLRQVVGSVMIVLSSHMNDAALQTIIEAIHTPKGPETNGIDEEADSDFETDEEDVEPKGEEEDENDDDGEEEEENEDMEEEDDSDEDNEAEEKDDGEIDDDFRNRVKTAMGKHAVVNEDSDEDIDMDDLDDEDIEKIDEALSNIFRSMCKKKSSSVKKKERQDALAHMHFKIRALDMLDIYLGHNPKLSHALFLMQPIIAALESAVKQKDHEPFQARLIGTLKKITSLKKLPLDDNMNKESFKEILQSLFDWGNSGSAVFPLLCHPIPLFGQCCSLVLKYAEKYEEANSVDLEVGKIYTAALVEFFVKNHCPLPLSLFMTAITSGCKSVLGWSETLSEHAFSAETRQFRRTHALTLFTALLKSPSFKDGLNEKQVKKFAKSVIQKLSAELLDCSKAKEVKPRYFCELLGFLHALHAAGAPGFDALKDPLEEVRKVIPANRFFFDVKKAFNKVAIHLGLETVKQDDKKKMLKQTQEVGKVSEEKPAEASNANGANGELSGAKKKKKKKPSHEALKRRKERKLFEIEGQFEGQEMPTFAGISLNANWNFEEAKGASLDQQESDKTAKKRKLKDKGQNGKKVEKKPKKVD